ncbi:helix-turn-helix domain-containing protein [candidate division KSB1 bacterium]|nr:helix-turn-helix domain-containing protein [candidate division KSB1 bacterium]
MSIQIMSVDEVAELFKVKPVTIRRQSELGELPGFKIGKSWRFRRIDIEKFIDEQIAQKKFSKKATRLWDDIHDELKVSEYTGNDVPKLVSQIRAKYPKPEGANENQDSD